MGAVWRATHIELDVEIALKFQRADTELGQGAEERFRREARAAAQLKSPHVVHIYDYGVHAGDGYIAMELLEGEDLGERLAREPRLPTQEAGEILSQAISGVQSAHRAGLVHRDIKPSNLFLASHSEEILVKVLDFGIAKSQVEGAIEITASGMVFGSPAYMSPEQARGGAVDERTDVWSLSAVLYRVLTGKLPFEGSNANDVIVKLCTQDPTPPSKVCSDLSEQWDVFFRSALSRDPANRPQSVGELRAELRSLCGLETGDFARRSSPSFTAEALKSPGRDVETVPLDPPHTRSAGGGASRAARSVKEGVTASLVAVSPPMAVAPSVLAVQAGPKPTERHVDSTLTSTVSRAQSRVAPSRVRRALLVAAPLALALVAVIWLGSREQSSPAALEHPASAIGQRQTEQVNAEVSQDVVETKDPADPSAFSQKQVVETPTGRLGPQHSQDVHTPNPEPGGSSEGSSLQSPKTTRRPVSSGTRPAVVERKQPEPPTKKPQPTSPRVDPVFGLPVESP
jgi:serine/threonine-protein kinase